jgi:Leishmanolysin
MKSFAVQRPQTTVSLLYSQEAPVDYRDPKPFSISPMRQPSGVILIASLAVMVACSDSSGPPVSLAVKSGDGQQTLAGTAVPAPIIVTAPGKPTFTVIAGGGTLSSSTGTVNSDGTITAPTWTLGQSADTQQLQVSVGTQTILINATVKTSYRIDVRFFGRALTAAQQVLFTNAAARVRAIIVGTLPTISPAGIDPSKCGVPGVTTVGTANLDGLIIYASIDSIDGRGKILARSGPCYYLDSTDFRTVLGVMKFDSADINTLAGSGNLQEVITHEMLHVLGFGVFWDQSAKNLLINDSTPNVAYIGTGGIAGCKAVGAPVTCASSVPVEGTQGGPGTLYTHWRESTFGNELMTGFLNTGTNPLSVMTVRSFEDLGYTVNPAAADAYSPPLGTAFRSNIAANAGVTSSSGGWETRLAQAPRPIPIPRKR